MRLFDALRRSKQVLVDICVDSNNARLTFVLTNSKRNNDSDVTQGVGYDLDIDIDRFFCSMQSQGCSV